MGRKKKNVAKSNDVHLRLCAYDLAKSDQASNLNEKKKYSALADYHSFVIKFQNQQNRILSQKAKNNIKSNMMHEYKIGTRKVRF